MKFTTVKYFVDTNIFVYLFSTETDKRTACINFLKSTKGKATLVISTQVVSEFTAVMLNKFNMSPNSLKRILEDFKNFEVVPIAIPIVESAINIQALNQLSFWDSQIVSAAQSAHCTAIVSEDLNHGQKIEGMEIINPMRL